MTVNIGKFGAFMSWLSNQTRCSFSNEDCVDIAAMINNMVDIQPIQPIKTNCAEIDQLMMLMVEGTRKIEAIKCHRQLTGLGLNESKDAVEKYWKPNTAPFKIDSD